MQEGVLKSFANKDRATRTLGELKRVLAQAGVSTEDLEFGVDNENGMVTFEGTSFTYSEAKLRMMGYCQKCAMSVPSYPIYNLADVASYMETFKAAKHECMDV